jgi:antibiotic biosynthesis monooxygenase (ABM) superfamily enzyme
MTGSLIAFLFVYWRYNKEMKIRNKWMAKKLAKGKKANWKIILAIFIAFNIASLITNLTFSVVSDNYILKPFFCALFVIPLFVIILFKYFYEIIGGKREWKL